MEYSFEQLNLSKHLRYAIEDLGFEKPTPIQAEAFPVILSGKDVVGISQTGTGKTLAFMLPLLDELKFSKQTTPRIVVLVPTRELVIQLVEQIQEFSKYMDLRVVGVYGGVNMNPQREAVAQGCDIVVGTPGRLYDLTLTRALQLKAVKKLVIDEVDIMLDLGFRVQLTNIFELLPERRQNIMFSATMTEEVDALIDDFFIAPHKIAIALSGTPLENISQQCYAVENFYTKVNLLAHLLEDKEEFRKVLVFTSNKKTADRLFSKLEEDFSSEMSIIHSNKTQNYRIKSIEAFDEGTHRVLIATDIIARGLDFDKVSHVINFDTPTYPENYMHRIGRTGRAEEEGKTILFYTEKEASAKLEIEDLMDYKIPQMDFPSDVEISKDLLPEEQPDDFEGNHNRNLKKRNLNPGFHEKKEKNKKTNQGGSYYRELAKKYKKPKTKGDKNFNRRNKKK
ncbi:DEAD/DEAH box helicase [Vicingus serpentipes]|uniref:DEAD/DEAH box helicase n=1 Tax=Vicingus serpentipes TaxID=1926625 RepID=A0A5C6RVE3_9FLAO|nr:DEAD/DEAH box helicase [Vicingus serpentipes]TXB65859.1 DEAD/DEAH box helicase [Vicingus serpentipes]